MDKKEIFDFINFHQACHMATAEGDTPHVRGMMLYRADENGIIFHTGDMKDIHKQLSKNPKVELCFNDFQKNIQVRVSGKAVLDEDKDLKKEIVEKRPFLKPWVEKQGYDMLKLYRIKELKATVWTFETNFAPKTYIKLS